MPDTTTDARGLDGRSLAERLAAGEHSLAAACWALYLAGCGLFFALGGRAVDEGRWPAYLAMAAAMLAWTLLLVAGVRAAYRGPQLWKVMSRTSSVFMVINVLVGICTLGFVR